ncbi:hypothetical protein CXF54_05990 [Olleya sp. 1-3]|nr:hypothetical protein CXF54_05990 [Olleya sp. 1-3]
MIDEYIKVAKTVYSNNVMEFSPGGIYTQKTESKITQYGKYKTNLLDKKINITLKDDINFEMEYKFENALLYL